MATIEFLAESFVAQFQRKTRANGDTFYSLKDDSPEWMTDALYSAHDGMLPDDWKFESALNLLSAISEGADPDDLHEAIDSQIDVYTGRLTAWLATSLTRVAYCDQAREEYGEAETLEKTLQAGQYLEISEIAAALIAALREQEDDSEDPEDCGGTVGVVSLERFKA